MYILAIEKVLLNNNRNIFFFIIFLKCLFQYIFVQNHCELKILYLPSAQPPQSHLVGGLRRHASHEDLFPAGVEGHVFCQILRHGQFTIHHFFIQQMRTTRHHPMERGKKKML